MYCVEVLLSNGAALESRNKLGDTPLHSAAWGAHPDAIAHLLAAGMLKAAVFQAVGQIPICARFRLSYMDGWRPGRRGQDSGQQGRLHAS